MGSSSRYRWLAVKVRSTASTSASELVPSPQITVTLWVSSVPTSKKRPLSVATPFSSIVGVTDNSTISGATLRTVRVFVAVPIPPSSSVTSALIVNAVDDVRVLVSSRY